MSIFIPADALPHLKEYKYQSEDRSITTKFILKPFWQKFVNIFPLSMAPNMVTLLGLMFIIVSDLLMLYYDPDYKSTYPSWVYIYNAIAVFMYQTFDACDGMHARRTGQSSPLGELFDHCCDSMNTTLMVIQFCSVAGVGKTWAVFITQFSSLTNFYMSTWEEYYTHKLFLAEFSGPVEGLLMISSVFFLTGIVGKEYIYDLELFTLPYTGIVVSSKFLSAAAGAIVMSFCIFSARKNVVDVLKRENRSHEMQGAHLGLVPFFTYYATVFGLLLAHPVIISNYTTPMVLTIGATVSFCVGRIITGHLTKQKFPYFNLPTLLPTIQLAAVFISTYVWKVSYDDAIAAVVWCGFAASILYYGVFVTEIIYDITTYLDIWALTIKHPQKIKD